MSRTSVSTPASAIIAQLPPQAFETQDEPPTDPQEDEKKDHRGEVHHHNHLVSASARATSDPVGWPIAGEYTGEEGQGSFKSVSPLVKK